MSTDLATVQKAIVSPGPVVSQGLAVADELVRGMVVKDETDVALLVDKMAVVKRAAVELPKLKERVLQPFMLIRQTLDFVDTQARTYAKRLDDARKAAQASMDAYRRAESARLERERVQHLVAQRAAEAKAKEEAELIGEDVPPPVDLVEQKTPNMIRGGAGAAVSVKRLACELVNAAECDLSLLTLDSRAALRVGEAAMVTGDLELSKDRPGKENSRVYRGVRYWYNATETFR